MVDRPTHDPAVTYVSGPEEFMSTYGRDVIKAHTKAALQRLLEKVLLLESDCREDMHLDYPDQTADMVGECALLIKEEQEKLS